jgi:hypothetical protein
LPGSPRIEQSKALPQRGQRALRLEWLEDGFMVTREIALQASVDQ